MKRSNLPVIAIAALAFLLATNASADKKYPYANSKRTYVILTAVCTTLLAGGVATLGAAAGVWNQAPQAPTVTDYQRDQSISKALLYAGTASALLGGLELLFVAPGLSRALREERERAAQKPLGLWVAPSGTGVALGGTF